MNCDTAFIRINRSTDEVFSFMSDPARMSLWSFGTWRTEIDATGLIYGTSIKDGAAIYVRIEAHEDQKLIDYHVGHTPETLSPRIYVRIVSAEVFGDDEGTGLAMTVLRAAGMTDARWVSLQATHRVELDIIKSALETGFDHSSS